MEREALSGPHLLLVLDPGLYESKEAPRALSEHAFVSSSLPLTDVTSCFKFCFDFPAIINSNWN